MDISHVFMLLGGLALFLLGMQMMSSGLENVAGNKMKAILEKLTSNRLLGVFVGALITAVIQSSSATTVMVLGFVSTRIMTLNQAVWIIMGANIGTTITGQLVALDIGAAAPLIVFFGVVVLVFIKRQKIIHWGQILAGFGILFIGMDMMGQSMYPLRESQLFLNVMTEFSSPILGIIVGALFTALIQSSSAAVGILQTLASQNLISFSSSVFVLFGMNIGTCITSVIASIGANRDAKCTTLIHLFFNLIGTMIFTCLCLILPIADWVALLSPTSPESQIANMHTLFNVVTTLLLLPFGNYFAFLAKKIMRISQTDNALQGEHLPLIEQVKKKGLGLVIWQFITNYYVKKLLK